MVSFRKTSLALSITSLMGVAPAFAEESPQTEQQDLTIEQVVVTAQKREQNLQDVPISVSVVNAEELERQFITETISLAESVPSLNFQGGFSPSSTNFNIRGIGSYTIEGGIQPSVAMVVDGVSLARSGEFVTDLADVERVEILRGPQGTLFGRNSTGGAINITTKKPTGELGGTVEASAGNDGYQRYRASVDLPKFFDMLSVKLSAMHMEYDGWADNDFPGQEQDLGSEDNDSYRAAFRLEPTERLTLDYVYDKTDNEGVPTPFQITEVKDSFVKIEIANNVVVTVQKHTVSAVMPKGTIKSA